MGKIIVAILLVVVLCTGCLPEENRVHNVTFDGREELYEYEDDQYKAGENVVVYFTAVGTDTDYSFFMNGVKIEPEYDDEKGYKIEFIMPANDVDISYQSNNSMAPDMGDGMDNNVETEDMSPIEIVSLKIGDELYSIEKDTNATANEFFEKASSEKISLKMKDYGGFEKNAVLPWELPTDEDDFIVANPGDIVLYQGNTLALLYGENEADYTRIGRIGETLDVQQELFEKLKKSKDVDVEIMVEYTE